MEIYREERSVVLRYARQLRGADPKVLRRVSLREGARLVRLPPRGGVEIDVLDLSTLSTTGTFKDWVACVAVAASVARGHDAILAQSSGNTANALARYASNAGIRCVILYPPTSRRRLYPQLADVPGVDFVEVDAPEHEIKQILRDYSRRSGIPAIPALPDQYEGNKLRAYFLSDASDRLGCNWDWHVQALSSAFGPFGFYRGMQEIQRIRHSAMPTPRFLGIQQEAVFPYARAVAGASAEPAARMIEPTLFRQVLTPELIDEMRGICATSGGTVRHLTNRRYLDLEQSAIAVLAAAGVAITLDGNGEPRERAGLYSLTGAIDAIDHALIKPGERVLVVHTGGSGPAVATTFEPNHVASQRDAPAVIASALAAQREVLDAAAMTA